MSQLETLQKNCPRVSNANWCMTHHPTIKETEIMLYLAPGFSDNQQLDNLYYQNYDQYNKLMPSQFIEIGDGPFIELFEKMSGQNQLLEGNQEFLKDAQFIPLIKSCMNADLHDRFAEPNMEVAKLYNLIVNGKVDPANDETLPHWAHLVELEDEKLRREREKCQRETCIVLNELKCGHNNAFQSNGTASVTAPVHSFAPFPQIPPMPQSFPAFANTFYGPNVAAMSQNQNQNQVHPFQAFSGNQGQLAPHYSNLEKYQVLNIKFINCWVQAHPNGFENCCVPDPSVTPHRPYMITAEHVTNAVARQQAKGDIVLQYFLNIAQSTKPGSQFSAASSSNAIPLRPSSHSQNVAPEAMTMNCSLLPPHNVRPHRFLKVDWEDFEHSGICDVPDHAETSLGSLNILQSVNILLLSRLKTVDYDIASEDPGLTLGLELCTVVSETSSSGCHSYPIMTLLSAHRVDLGFMSPLDSIFSIQWRLPHLPSQNVP
ncbi:hypothetical protein ARMGADRAFT_1031963 [Armillaria gallica]|uniref:Uncharacterized protein n=1 Tax=Armillaria gallica TaxID=47427 RepID=A0A2H3DII9_ARMGA|nr:hypothetical protein ARMGADRAFT_1031963 [Armillaria gallica]